MNPVAQPLSDYPPPGMEIRLIRALVELTGRRVLEIGCGDGRLTRQIARLAASVVAYDPDRARVATARRAAAAAGIHNVSIRVGSAEKIQAGRASFDVALFSWSL